MPVSGTIKKMSSVTALIGILLLAVAVLCATGQHLLVVDWIWERIGLLRRFPAARRLRQHNKAVRKMGPGTGGTINEIQLEETTTPTPFLSDIDVSPVVVDVPGTDPVPLGVDVVQQHPMALNTQRPPSAPPASEPKTKGEKEKEKPKQPVTRQPRRIKWQTDDGAADNEKADVPSPSETAASPSAVVADSPDNPTVNDDILEGTPSSVTPGESAVDKSAEYDLEEQILRLHEEELQAEQQQIAPEQQQAPEPEKASHAHRQQVPAQQQPEQDDPGPVPEPQPSVIPDHTTIDPDPALPVSPPKETDEEPDGPPPLY